MTLTLYSAPRTRALRVVWLMEELGLPCEIRSVEFKPTVARFFIQDTPTGKLPTLVDGELVICESGAIVQYLLARYADGALAPAPVDPDFGRYLQWFHFAESTAFPPLGIVIWLTLYRGDADRHAELVEDARARAATAFEWLETRFGEGPWLLGDRFTAADVMLGFTLLAGRLLGVLDGKPALAGYLERIEARPAFARARIAVGGFG
jgi:glutathione S-transferase